MHQKLKQLRITSSTLTSVAYTQINDSDKNNHRTLHNSWKANLLINKALLAERGK